MSPVFWLVLSTLLTGGGSAHTQYTCPTWECVQRTVASETPHGLYRVQVFGEKPVWVGHDPVVPALADYRLG